MGMWIDAHRPWGRRLIDVVRNLLEAVEVAYRLMPGVSRPTGPAGQFAARDARLRRGGALSATTLSAAVAGRRPIPPISAVDSEWQCPEAWGVPGHLFLGQVNQVAAGRETCVW